MSIVKKGGSTPADGSIDNDELAPMPNNTVKGNKSGSSASPQDLVLSDVVEATSSVLTITNGSKAVVAAANLSIEVDQADASNDGYLSSIDWNIFNNKQDAVVLDPGFALISEPAGGIDAFTSLLLHLDNTTTDSSQYSNTVILDDTSGFTTGKFAQAFDFSAGAQNRLRIDSGASSGIFDFASGDFTIDMWVRRTVSSAIEVLLSSGSQSAPTDWHLRILGPGVHDTKLEFNAQDGAFAIRGGAIIADGLFHHVEVVRSVNNVQIYLDGVSIASGTIAGAVPFTPAFDISVGAWYDGYSGQSSSYIDEVRISKGIARHTSPFTPPTQAYSGIVGGDIVESVVTSVELAALSGIDSNVQDQLDSLQGNITIGAFGSTPNASGLSLSGDILTLQPADATNPGALSTGTQTIAGAKTFSGAIAASNLSGTNSGDVTLAAVGSSPNANAASLSGQVLNLQPADATNPGVVTTGTQTFAGTKTFSGRLNADGGIDHSSGGTLSIGPTDATVINIGNIGATINMIGTVNNENVTNLNVTDKLITLNDTGGAGSAASSGIELEEAAVATAYVKTSADRNSWLIKAPNTAGEATITPGAGGINLNQSSHDPVTLAAVGSSPNANAASLSSQALTLQPADATNPGVITSGTQTIGGAKTFAGAISASNLSGTNSGDVTLAAVGASPNANGATLSGQALTLQPANTTNPGVLTATDWNTFNNKLTSTLTDGNILVGNASNVATSVNPSGDVDVSNAGVFSINAGVIVNADINAAAAIDATKIADGSVTSAEFQFINSLTSNAQTQINTKANSTDVQVFTANGTWTKPSGAKWVTALCVGGGGGGGSGALCAAGAGGSGGAGGGGASYRITRVYDATDLAASVAVTVGAGGTGGTAVTTAAAAGVAGGIGNNSSFGTLLVGYSGGGGAGGLAAANRAGGSGAGTAGDGLTGAGAALDGGLPNLGSGAGIAGGGAGVSAINTIGQPAEFGGGAGGGSNTSGAGKTGGTSVTGAGGGGAGGGINTTTGDFAGGVGGANNTYNAAGGGGGAAGAAGAGGAGGAGSVGPSMLYNGSGGGGGGGSALSTFAAGAGGAGGTYGGGGAGGGAGRVVGGAGSSGAGGAGGAGIVIVTTFF